MEGRSTSPSRSTAASLSASRRSGCSARWMRRSARSALRAPGRRSPRGISSTRTASWSKRCWISTPRRRAKRRRRSPSAAAPTPARLKTRSHSAWSRRASPRRRTCRTNPARSRASASTRASSRRRSSGWRGNNACHGEADRLSVFFRRFATPSRHAKSPCNQPFLVIYSLPLTSFLLGASTSGQ